ncbi:MAG: metabolite traffic protein EboE [Syntrophotaleaceae bacterium]
MPSKPRITYCTNIHAAESWAETFSSLRQYVPVIKAAVSPDDSFPIGLRLSARAAWEMTICDRAFFRQWLDEKDCTIPTLNGFPFGAFHGSRIKESVYLPDWTSRDRAAYTLRLAELLREWLPTGMTGSISTVPLGFRTLADAADPEIRKNLETVLTFLDKINEKTGKKILLALEPEPGCLLETADDVCRFFDSLEISSLLQPYLGVCFDCCHHAVTFENLVQALAVLESRQISIVKLQITSAIRLKGVSPAQLALLDEPCYLHQVFVRDHQGRVTRFSDIPQALSQKTPEPEEEWRCHFHVPIHRATVGPFETTQDDLLELLPSISQDSLLEVETYTWRILPEDRRGDSPAESVIREIQWLQERFHA